MIVNSLLLFCFVWNMLINRVVIFNRVVKRVEDSGTGGWDSLDELGESA